MENIIVLTISISVVFLIVKLLEMKYIEKEIKPLKTVVKDSLIVGVSSFICVYVFFQFKTVIFDTIGKSFGTGGVAEIIKTPEIFTDNPGF
jgi:hypothetical protein